MNVADFPAPGSDAWKKRKREFEAGVPLPPEGVTIDDFYAYMPAHLYIFTPTRELWPSSSVNARIPVKYGPHGKPIYATDLLDTNRAVEQMVWAPAEPMIIYDRLVSNGGWIARDGCKCFNIYLPPTLILGDPANAGPWIDHVRRVYPTDADHIIKWLAHRVQRPGEKINHALVLGGLQGIGKDTLLEPIKHAVGPWNFNEISPIQLLGRFNGFVKSTILRISEARDLGDVNRYSFYDHLKVYASAPPDVLRCDEKNIREHSVMNVCGIIITSNHLSDGVYLPADDRRHFVAWSSLDKDSFETDYWRNLYQWYADTGIQDVAAYLKALDLSGFDPKAPPPKTAAFHAIVDANRSPEDAELADALDRLGNPAVVTLAQLDNPLTDADFRAWLQDRRNRRQIPHRLEGAGYVPVRNDAATDGLWKLGSKRQTIYGNKALSVHDRHVAVAELLRQARP